MPRRGNKERENDEVLEPSALEENILWILFNGERRYGLEILDILNKERFKQGLRDIKMGSLYPTFGRMEDVKLIQGEWGEATVDGTKRKYYRITMRGLIALERTWTLQRTLAKQKHKFPTPKILPEPEIEPKTP